MKAYSVNNGLGKVVIEPFEYDGPRAYRWRYVGWGIVKPDGGFAASQEEALAEAKKAISRAFNDKIRVTKL